MRHFYYYCYESQFRTILFSGGYKKGAKFTTEQAMKAIHVQKAGWAPGPVWTGVKNLAPTGIRSPDRPARSESMVDISSYNMWFMLSGFLLPLYRMFLIISPSAERLPHRKTACVWTQGDSCHAYSTEK